MKIVSGASRLAAQVDPQLHSAAAELSVQCFVCRRMVPFKECLVDLDGIPFTAYYHSECLVNATDEELA